MQGFGILGYVGRELEAVGLLVWVGSTEKMSMLIYIDYAPLLQ
jgi:hypothetical protein